MRPAAAGYTTRIPEGRLPLIHFADVRPLAKAMRIAAICMKLRSAKELHQPRFAWGKIVAPALRNHERERTEVPSAAFEFDELSACQILVDEVPRQVSPAQTGLEQITLGAEIIDQPLALAGNALLGLFRSGLVVRHDDLNVSAELVHGDGVRCRSEWMGRRTCRHHLRLA